MLKTKYQDGQSYEQIDGGDWKPVIETSESRRAGDARIAEWSQIASEQAQAKEEAAAEFQAREIETPEERRQSDRTFAEMAAAGHGPMVAGTDSQWFRGWGTKDQYEDCPVLGDKLREIAEKKKPGCTHNAQRNHQIATGIDDTECWIQSRGDLLKRAKQVGRDCDTGAVKYVAPKKHIEVPNVRLAKDLVTKVLRAMVRQDPGLLQRRNEEDVREEIIEKYGAKL